VEYLNTLGVHDLSTLEEVVSDHIGWLAGRLRELDNEATHMAAAA
jgi:hypothetical protein